MAFKKLKVKVGQVTGTHTNFPTLIQPSLITGLGSITLAEAQSARFYSDVGKTTEIAREIVSADEIHVKVTSMEALAEIWMDYDGIRSDYAVTATYGRNAVWSDYYFVYHLDDTTTSTVTDSAGNEGGSKTGANQPIENTGKINEAQDFTGGNYKIEIDTGTSAWANATQGAITAWFKTSSNANLAIYGDGSSTTNNSFMVVSVNDGVMKNNLRRSSSSDAVVAEGSTAIDDNIWHKSTFYSSGSANKLYTDGVDEGASIVTEGTGFDGAWFDFANDSVALDNHGIGVLPRTSDVVHFDGSIDELRLRKTATGDNWETTEYNNQNANGSFWEATDAGGGGAAQVARRGAVMMM